MMSRIDAYELQLNSMLDDDDDLRAYVSRLESMSDAGITIEDDDDDFDFDEDDSQLQFDFAMDSGDAWSARVNITTSALLRWLTGSRSGPRGSSQPFPNGWRASRRQISTSRWSCQYCMPSSRTMTSG
jgi:hypothetical protein